MRVTSKELVIGTGNPRKLDEIKVILGQIPWTMRSLNDFEPIAAPEEHGKTYLENAILKAQFYATAINQWILADDSGLEVDALRGAPGLYSARYAGDSATDADRRALLLSELQKTATSDRSARFVCAVAICRPDGIIASTTEGKCEGVIIESARGHGGFGYDPLFKPLGYGLTFGELPADIKNRISHRGEALTKAKEFLSG